MLERYLVQTCDIVTLIRNSFGDYWDSDHTSEPCRFREVSTIRREGHAEQNDSDAMLWLGPDSVAVKGSTILFDGVYYQIERLTKARKLGGDVIQFLKCDLKILDLAIS